MKALYCLPGKHEKLTLSPLSCIKLKCSVIDCVDTCHIWNERMHNRWKRMWVGMWDRVCEKEQAWGNMHSSCLNILKFIHWFPPKSYTYSKSQKRQIFTKPNEILGCFPRWKNRDCIYPTLNNQKIRKNIWNNNFQTLDVISRQRSSAKNKWSKPYYLQSYDAKTQGEVRWNPVRALSLLS